MRKQNITFDEVYDLFAIRVILDVPPEQEKAACWQVYSIVTDFYQPNPDRLRDWVSTPKANGYESLHTTVMSRTGPVGGSADPQPPHGRHCRERLRRPLEVQGHRHAPARIDAGSLDQQGARDAGNQQLQRPRIHGRVPPEPVREGGVRLYAQRQAHHSARQGHGPRFRLRNSHPHRPAVPRGQGQPEAAAPELPAAQRRPGRNPDFAEAEAHRRMAAVRHHLQGPHPHQGLAPRRPQSQV